MKSSLRGSLVGLLALLAVGLAGCATVTPLPTADETARADQAVRASLARLNEVLAKRDVPGFLALWDDSDAIMVVGSDVGEVSKGRKDVGAFIRWIYSQKFTFAFDLKEVTVHPERDFAWAYVEGRMLHVKPDGTSSAVPYRFALMLVKRDAAWRWQLFHGSIPRGE